MPTAASIIFSTARLDPVFDADDANETIIRVKLAASTTFAAGTVLGEVSATPGTYKAYASGNSDGSQNPAGILQYGATTDASSNILNADEWGNTALTAPMYTRGYFRTQELTGLDANAVTKLSGRLIEGSVTNGIVKI